MAGYATINNLFENKTKFDRHLRLCALHFTRRVHRKLVDVARVKAVRLPVVLLGDCLLVPDDLARMFTLLLFNCRACLHLIYACQFLSFTSFWNKRLRRNSYLQDSGYPSRHPEGGGRLFLKIQGSPLALAPLSGCRFTNFCKFCVL